MKVSCTGARRRLAGGRQGPRDGGGPAPMRSGLQNGSIRRRSNRRPATASRRMPSASPAGSSPPLARRRPPPARPRRIRTRAICVDTVGSNVSPRKHRGGERSIPGRTRRRANGRSLDIARLRAAGGRPGRSWAARYAVHPLSVLRDSHSGHLCEHSGGECERSATAAPRGGAPAPGPGLAARRGGDSATGGHRRERSAGAPADRRPGVSRRSVPRGPACLLPQRASRRRGSSGWRSRATASTRRASIGSPRCRYRRARNSARSGSPGARSQAMRP